MDKKLNEPLSVLKTVGCWEKAAELTNNKTIENSRDLFIIAKYLKIKVREEIETEESLLSIAQAIEERFRSIIKRIDLFVFLQIYIKWVEFRLGIKLKIHVEDN